jgi:hypothetical protein
MRVVLDFDGDFDYLCERILKRPGRSDGKTAIVVHITCSISLSKTWLLLPRK